MFFWYDVLGLSKGVVQKFVSLASAGGLDWARLREWDERQLEATLLPRSPATVPVSEPDWATIHPELDRKGVTLMLLGQEYVEAHPEWRT